jgi:hypothetical protein
VYVDSTALGLDKKGRLHVRKVLGRGLLLLTVPGGRIVSLDEKGRTIMPLRPGEQYATERVQQFTMV